MKISGNRKGQAAIEYMVTYGWAILVLAVVGIVLWQWNVFTPPAPEPDCRGFSQIQVFDQIAKNNGDFTLVLVNDAGTKMTIKKGTVNATIGGKTCTGSGPAADIKIGPGAKKMINITGCAGLKKFIAGDSYRAKVTIGYYNPSSKMSHTSSGVCWGPVE